MKPISVQFSLYHLAWRLIVWGIVVLGGWLSYGIFVLPYQKAAAKELDWAIFSKVRQRKIRLFVFIATIFLLLEIFARIWIPLYKRINMALNPEFRSYVEMDTTLQKIVRLENSFMFPKDPRLPSHMGIPYYTRIDHPMGENVLGVSPGTRFYRKANSLGFLSEEPVMPKPDGEFRIFCLGGSTTEQGMSNETAYPALMEHYLSIAGYKNVRVYNFGIASYSSLDNLLRLKEYLTYDPNLLVVMDGVNEFRHISLRPELSSTVLDSRFLGLIRQTLDDPKLRWSRIKSDIMAKTIRNFELMIADAQKANVEIAFIGFVSPDFSKMNFRDWHYYACQIAYRYTNLYSPQSYQRGIDMINEFSRDLADRYGVMYFDAPRRFGGRGKDMFFDPMHRRIPMDREWSQWLAEQLIQSSLLPSR